MLVGKLNAKKLSMDTKWIYIEMSDRYSKPMHTDLQHMLQKINMRTSSPSIVRISLLPRYTS